MVRMNLEPGQTVFSFNWGGYKSGVEGSSGIGQGEELPGPWPIRGSKPPRDSGILFAKFKYVKMFFRFEIAAVSGIALPILVKTVCSGS